MMSACDVAVLEAAETALDRPSERAIRAAEEYMVAVKTAPGLYEVYSGETSVYTVDARGPACDCPDFQYRGGPEEPCKHILRVRMLEGVDRIPAGTDPDPVLLTRREDQ